MFCTKCGAQLPDSAKFCTKCGAVLKKETVQPSSEPAAPKSGEKRQAQENHASADRNTAAHTNSGSRSAQDACAEPRGGRSGRKKWLLPAVLGAAALAGCLMWTFLQRPSSPTPKSSADAPALSAAASSLSAAAPSVPEPQQPADAFVDVEPLSDFSEGLAFARVTLPDGSEKCAYINLEGEIAVELPDGYNYGFAFHDGYAAVCNLQDSREWTADSKIGDAYLSSPTLRYNLIDTQSTPLFNSQEYCYIGPVGEGKVLTRTIKQDYNGTVQVVAFRDLQENIVWEVDIETLYSGLGSLETDPSFQTDDNYLRAPWTSRYRNGITTLYSRSDFYGYIYCFDGAGNCLETLHLGASSHGADDNPSVDGFDEYLTSDINERGSGLRGIYNRSSNTFVPLEELPTPDYYTTVSLWPEEYGLTGLGYFMQGRNIAMGGKERFFIYDSSGNILLDKAEPAVQRIVSGMDDHWIVELQNGYYGLLDLNGDLCMEPVQEEILPMGSGLYLLRESGAVINASGEVQFTLPDEYTSLHCPVQPTDLYPADGRYHEGVAVLDSVYSNVPSVYADMRGNILRTSTDFREYSDWLRTQGPAPEQADDGPSAGSATSSSSAG